MNKTVSVIGQIETDVIEQIENSAKYLLELKYNDFLPVQPGLQEEKIHILPTTDLAHDRPRKVAICVMHKRGHCAH